MMNIFKKIEKKMENFTEINNNNQMEILEIKCKMK